MHCLLRSLGFLGFLLGLGYHYFLSVDYNPGISIKNTQEPVLPQIVKSLDYHALEQGLASITFNNKNEVIVNPSTPSQLILAMQHMPYQPLAPEVVDRVSHMIDILYSAKQKTQLLDLLAKVAIYRERKNLFIQSHHIHNMPTTIEQLNLLTKIQDETFGHNMAAALFGHERIHIALKIKLHHHEQQ